MSTTTVVTTLLQLVGLLLLAASVVVTSRRQSEAQDTMIVINVGQDYRQRWESGAQAAVERLEQRSVEPASPHDYELLASMLNWIDWLGVLVHRQAFRKPELVLDTVGRSMARILTLGYFQIASETAQRGRAEWSGALEIAGRLAGRGLIDPARYPAFGAER